MGIKLPSIWPEMTKLAPEIGLGENDLSLLGGEWKELCVVWADAELALTRSGKKAKLSAEVPSFLVEWMTMKREKKDTANYSPGSGQVVKAMSEWWKVLDEGAKMDGSALVKQDWCAPGMGGIGLILLGMKWWGFAVQEDGRCEEEREEWAKRIKVLSAMLKLVPDSDAW